MNFKQIAQTCKEDDIIVCYNIIQTILKERQANRAMSVIANLIKDSRKIVVKIGSNTLSGENGMVNREAMQNIVEQLHELMQSGKQIIIVSSGAGVCGIAAINKWHRKNDINYKQALCAIGQVELMMTYKELFAEYDIHVAQMLLTRDDFGDHTRNIHIRNALFTLVDEGVVPVVNENDSVCVEEIKIGDNDTLSALTANLWGADLLIILSDIDGVYDKNPKTSKDAELIEEVYDIDGLLSEIDARGKSHFGTGGVITKISAAEKVNEYGIPLILANGSKKDILRKLVNGTERGTVFFGK
ncbi:MAG: glutamate 5-kinase [Eubacteriales bacterium]|nr:glutamate 5-kinase [Eubacteriales bacterium]